MFISNKTNSYHESKYEYFLIDDKTRSILLSILAVPGLQINVCN